MAKRYITRVPAGPFAKWVSKRARNVGSIKRYAEIIDEDQMWLGKLIGMDFKTVEVKKVDAIMCKDDTAHIRELYPELYEEQE